MARENINKFYKGKIKFSITLSEEQKMVRQTSYTILTIL